MPTKNGNRQKETTTTNEAPRYTYQNTKGKKSRQKEQKKRRVAGNYCYANICNNKQRLLALSKWAQKSKKKNKQPKQKKKTKIYLYTLKANNTSRQNKQASVSYANINMCVFV